MGGGRLSTLIVFVILLLQIIVPLTAFQDAQAQDGGGGGQGRGNLSRLTGRVLGFVALVLMVLLLPTGGTVKSWCRAMNKAFGNARKRVRFHCYTSYLLFITTILHAMMLMYTHYRDVMYNGFFLWADGVPGINLGTIALVLMICISLGGIFQKRLCKRLGYKTWRKLHGWLTWSALILIIIHLLMVGTTIGLPLRTALGL